jgi:uncharacterized membrane protein HdeD (DUF308 family)
MRTAKIGYIVISAVFCIVGGFMMAKPELSQKWIGLFFGIAMMVFGIVKLIGYFSKDLYRLAFQYDLQFGIILLLIGIVAVMRPVGVINYICIALGIAIMSDGLFRIRIALDAKEFGIRTWWLVLSLAALAVIIGFVLVFRPTESSRVLIMLFGAALIADGLLNFSVALCMVKIIKHQVPDTLEADCNELWD